MVDVKIVLLNLLMINNSNWLIPGLVSLSYGTWNDNRVMLLKIGLLRIEQQGRGLLWRYLPAAVEMFPVKEQSTTGRGL